MFITFLLLSIFFWFLSKFSKDYTHTVNFKTNYTNIATDKIMQGQPIDNINLTLKSRGFKLLTFNLKKPAININLTDVLPTKSGKYYYATKNHFANFQSQIGSETTLVSINTDTLFFNFGILQVKKVNVVPNLKLNFKNGFYLTNGYTIEPKQITITGSKKIIDSIKQISTNEIVIEDISNNFEKIIAIRTNNKIKYSTKKIKISANVEKFTEGNLDIEYKLINVPDSLELNTFSKKINISYLVSLKNFDKVSDKDFTIVCDFKKAKQDGLDYLVPELVKYSSLISELKITPKKIKYLIIK
jgi:hypothetical protein